MGVTINQWLDKTLSDFMYAPLDAVVKLKVTQTVERDFPIQFPGNYTIKCRWNNRDEPTVDIQFADAHEHLLFMLKHS